ncbi:MAG: tyrosine-type recombinase/integrase [Deltaproteobacteria bacterium]|nr:tyrosine-type recombinase/integrase [Deltaproteobacteria bacterium]
MKFYDITIMHTGSDIAPIRSKRKVNLPTIFTKEEVQKLFAAISGKHGLMAKLLYGCGLRLMECIRLRVKDIDFDRGRIFVRNATKGAETARLIYPNRSTGNCGNRLMPWLHCIKMILNKASAKSISQRLWPVSIHVLSKKPPGNTYFRPKNVLEILKPAKSCGIMCWNQVYKRL